MLRVDVHQRVTQQLLRIDAAYLVAKARQLLHAYEVLEVTSLSYKGMRLLQIALGLEYQALLLGVLLRGCPLWQLRVAALGPEFVRLEYLVARLVTPRLIGQVPYVGLLKLKEMTWTWMTLN